MNRKEAISIIESLFPADSEYPETRIKGISYLEQAKRETENWRNLPDQTIFRYAELCEQEERKQNRGEKE